jgi:hypothetical protein
LKGAGAFLTTAAVLGLLPAVCGAQDFSADVAYDPPKSQDASSRLARPGVASRLYVSKDRMRLDSRGLSETILLTDFGKRTTTAIYPAQKAYQDLAAGPPQYFRVTDAGHACPDWQKTVGREFACEKAGNERVAGRNAVKYRGNTAGAGGSAASVWIDPKLKFVIRWEDADGGAELRNIKEGAQAADLFAVPPGYGVLKAQRPGHWQSAKPK